MRIPTVTLKNKKGETIVVNASDYAEGSIPGINLNSGWSLVKEAGGTDEGHTAAKENRAVVEKQAAKAEELEAKAKKAPAKRTRKASK